MKILLIGLICLYLLSENGYAQVSHFKTENLQSTYHLLLGKFFYGHQKYTLAEDEFTKAIRFNRTNHDAYFELGKLYKDMSLIEKSIETRMVYRKKSIDMFERYLVGAKRTGGKKDPRKYDEARRIKRQIKSQIPTQSTGVVKNSPKVTHEPHWVEARRKYEASVNKHYKQKPMSLSRTVKSRHPKNDIDTTVKHYIQTVPGGSFKQVTEAEAIAHDRR